MEFTDDMTLGEARVLLRGLVDEGHACPCCTQLAKVYRRKLNAGMAVSLIRMYRIQGEREWIHLPTEIGARSREEGKLRYWGLVEEMTEPREDGGRAGWWRVTDRGGMFVREEIVVLSHAKIYDGRCLALTGARVSILDCLGAKFNYAELMYG